MTCEFALREADAKENYGVDNFQKIGDCLLPAAIDEEDRILYSAEKDGRWLKFHCYRRNAGYSQATILIC